MKYRAKIYIRVFHRHLSGTEITTIPFDDYAMADFFLYRMKHDIEQATGGHIEKYVDGIGWVVCEKPEVSDCKRRIGGAE